MAFILGWTLVWGVIWGLVCGIVAANRGRSGIGWFFLGFFFSFIAVIVLALIPPLNASPQRIVVQLQSTRGAEPNEGALENQIAGEQIQRRSKTGVWALALFGSMIALGKCLGDHGSKPESVTVTHTAAPVATPVPAASWADGAPLPTEPAPVEQPQVRSPTVSATPPAKQRQPTKRNLQIIVE